ncbi:FKBP-type peptidyl-prolyl cis-trans isomerase SlyD [Deinobacterium chartae]|uniref:Peptidyl-prolyl cis-trans isomerase n=1 Tax=Deinobacterium chartae TaxID=521158 RepID=A0A841I1K7_9DEIO|nr:peptidylprolyl isomerase [Deinobacterium chartae]MBB6098956.1 FKBP-type peptidyl-prolyl cis-trans isomerase SlyD [Deinobacterium chartae]
MRITDNKVVAIDYVLTIQGEVVDQSEGEPLVYLQGASNIIPGLERALEGKTVGDSLSVTVPPEEGYGTWDENSVEKIDRDNFDEAPEVGATYYAENADGSVLPFTVRAIEEDGVVIDFNHPLAGETLEFQVTVRSIRDARPEEIEHGHPHGESGEEGHHH